MKRDDGLHLLKAMAGTFLFTFGMNCFIVPSGLYSGGLLGICQIMRTILEEVFHMPVGERDIAGIIFFFLNLPLFCLAWLNIGSRFFCKTIVCVAVQTFFLTVIPVSFPLLPDAPFASAAVGGVICGWGVGLTLREGGSGGGQDVLGLVIMKYHNRMSVGKIAFMINLAVYAWCAFHYSLETVIYSLVYVCVSSAITDMVHLQNRSMGAILVSDNEESIQWIITNCNRSATVLEGRGGYSGKPYQVIYAALSGQEAKMLERYMKDRGSEAVVTFFFIDRIYGRFPKHL